MQSSATLWGSPGLPKIRETDGVERPLFVTQGGAGGSVDESLAGFAEAVTTMLAEPHVQKRVKKLRRDGHDEQHLFAVVDESAFPFPVTYALMARDVLPPGQPTLTGDLTHLWLLVTFTPWVLLGTSNGWARHEYTRQQGTNNKLGRTPPRHWLVFMADGGRRSRLLTAYENHGEVTAERTEDIRCFDLRPSQVLISLIGRLVVEWSRDAVNWAKSASSAASFPVVEIADPQVVAFPGFDRVLIPHAELQSVVEDSRYSAWRMHWVPCRAST